MRINGRFIYIDNHSLLNTEKMHKWSMDKSLLQIEAGDVNNIIFDIDTYSKQVMAAYISNTHKANTSFCHFGIHSISTSEIIGYVDLQNIDLIHKNAELSLSIPDKDRRNKGYGFDAFLTALYYSFIIRELNSIIVQTKVENAAVIQMAKKLRIYGSKNKVKIHGKAIDLLKYVINKVDFDKIRNLTTASTSTTLLSRFMQ